MGQRANRRRVEEPGGARRRAILLAAGVAVVAAVAGAALWLRPGTEGVGAGTPRLAVDRTEVDLGYRRFDTPARVAFTLTNAGDSPLRLTEAPPVKVVAGC